jgi:hypothetical protein
LPDVEEIKNILLKRICEVWNKSEEEVENLIKFDPALGLLFNAIVVQYQEIYNHHADFKNEILSDVAERLLPDSNFNASPSFGVIKANPISNSVLKLREDIPFSHQRKIREKIATLHYLPISDFELYPGDIKAIIANNTPAMLSEDFDFLNLKNIFHGKPVSGSENTILLGLSIPKHLVLQNKKLVFYIDYSVNNLEERILFDELAEGEWILEDFQCIVQKGIVLDYLDGHNTNVPYPMLEKTKLRIRDFYENNFLTLNVTQKRSEHQNTIPIFNEVKNSYSSLLWINVKLQSSVSVNFLCNNLFTVNAFPVMNFNIKTDSLSKNQIVKGIEFNEDEFFFDIFDNRQNETNFIIRDSRYKSFDSKDLLMEIRTLNRLFSQYRVFFDKLQLKEKELDIMNDFYGILLDLEFRAGNEGLDVPQYCITSKKAFEGVVKYRYLTTYGEFGNGGLPGDLFTFERPGLDEKSIVALTSFYGGRNPVEKGKIVDDFRQVLLARNRVVSREDIKQLVISVLGTKNIKHVKVSKTVSRALNKVGLQRAIKVSIHLKSDSSLNYKQLELFKKDLITQLESKSIGVFPFLIEVNS